MAIGNVVLKPDLLKVRVYTRGKSAEDLKRELGVEEVIKLGSNENPLGPSPRAIEAIVQATVDIHRYPSVETQDLRCKLSTSLGPDIDAENIVVGNGSADVICSAAHSFLSGRGESIIAKPAFQMYELATNMYGGQCIFVEADGFRLNLQAMVDQITDQTRLVFVTNPNNPTGLIVNQGEVDEFMEKVPSSVVVIFDEAYREYVDAADYPDTIRYVLEGRNVIITRTFSKVYGLAGVRMGYGIANKTLIEYLLHTQPPFHCDRLALVAAMASLEDQEHVKKSQQVNAQGKEYLYRSFEALGVECLPSQANFIMLVNLKHPVQSIDQALLSRGVIIRPTDPFDIPEAFRVTIGTPEENQRLVSAFGEVLEELG
jgi:histidinol-phosphate aminotransferase